jgi:hypothetical protein
MLLPVLFGIGLLMLAVLLVIVLGVRRLVFSTKETDPGMSLIVTKVAVTEASPTTTSPPITVPSFDCETIISSGDVQIATSAPISLTLSGTSIPVQKFELEDEKLGYSADNAGAGLWLCGTVVNYVILIEPTTDNEALLTAMSPGDAITLRLSNGVVLSFGFTQQKELKTSAMGDTFSQFEPRLTLLLEQEADTWLVTSADYVTRDEAGPAAGAQAQLNMPVRVGDVQVTVSEGYPFNDAPNLPIGTMYYMVEFSIENLGEQPLNTSLFTMQLQDGVGNIYLASPMASAYGNNGAIEETVAAGDTATGSAGYLVPNTLAGPMLIWTFSPSPSSEIWASVSIPHEGQVVTPIEPPRAQVIIDDALPGKNGTTLLIEGQVRNVGGTPLVIETRDVTLSSSSGMGELVLANPPLPWNIEPGNSVFIELQFKKPDAPSALLTVMGFSFDISGLD